jgi:tetratricopeptide (TPR) repeat protein
MPEPVIPAEPVVTPVVNEIDWQGQKISIPEVMRDVEEYRKLPKEDLGNLPKYKQAAEAYAEVEGLISTDPDLAQRIREAYAKKQGFIPAPKPTAPTGEQPKPTVELPKEVIEAINENKRISQALQAKIEAQEAQQGNQEANRQMQEALKAYPFFENKPEKVWDAARKYCAESAAMEAQNGANYEQAYERASYRLSAMPITEWPMVVSKQDYHKWLLNQQPGGGAGGPNPTVNPPAEAISGGQPGPTPELREQMKKEYRAALARNASQEELASIWLKYSTKSGSTPMSELGLDPGLARELARK